MSYKEVLDKDGSMRFVKIFNKERYIECPVRREIPLDLLIISPKKGGSFNGVLSLSQLKRKDLNL